MSNFIKADLIKDLLEKTEYLIELLNEVEVLREKLSKHGVNIGIIN
jgi:hypothetical protein